MPDWYHYVRRQLPALDIPPEREMEIVDELALQLEAAYEGALSRGASDADARAAALAEVPDWKALARTLVSIERPMAARVPRVIRSTADQPAIGAGGGGFMLGFVQDVRYAVRTLVRAPAFATAAILTLALGIGATTIVFSLVDGILLRPLPIKDPARVVLAREIDAQGQEFSVAWPNFLDWKARATSFENLAVWRGMPANLTGLAEPQRIMIRQVTWNLFDVLGVQPVLGRSLTAADDVAGVPRVALISYGFWQRHFGGDPSAVGKQIILDDTPVTIVGVLPRAFTVARVEDAFLPLGNFVTATSAILHRGNHQGLAAIGRLTPGVSLEAARAELTVIARQLEAAYPDTNSGNSATANLLYDVLVRQARPALAVLIGAVTAMLLIACVNIANLLLVRGAARAQELEVRRTLGAERWRLLRQLLTESVLLALVGGAAGVVLAYAGFGLFVALLPADQARVHMVEINGRVLLFAAAASVIAGLVFGLVPALQAGSSRAMALLRAARVAGAGGGRGRTRQLLLVAELSLALVLLVAAGLMVRTMQNLFSVDLGFEPEQLLSAQISLPPARYNVEQRRAFYDRVEERVGAIPGVTAVAFTLSLPVQNSNWGSVFIVDGQPVPARAELPAAAMIPSSPSYLETIGVRLRRGRAFTRMDTDGSPHVAVVNESFARRFWPNGDAIGKRFKQGWPESPTPWREIVGVVDDVKIGGIDVPSGLLQVYLPIAQEPSSAVALVARADGDPARLGTAVEAAIHEVDPNLPVYDVRTLTQVIQLAVGQQRLLMVLLLGFGGLALVLAAVGVFGVNAYAVSQRTHELGVRMALGADRGRVLRLVLRQGLTTCVLGIAIGLAAALGLTRLLTRLLYQIQPHDPATLMTVTVVLFAVTAAACYLPARRATRIDPVAALRAD